MVTIYFTNDFFIAIKRTEFYEWMDFLSRSGGLLGLFMVSRYKNIILVLQTNICVQGFSILSLVEVVYHFTLRWILAKNNSRVEPAKGINHQWVSAIQ